MVSHEFDKYRTLVQNINLVQCQQTNNQQNRLDKRVAVKLATGCSRITLYRFRVKVRVRVSRLGLEVRVRVGGHGKG